MPACAGAWSQSSPPLLYARVPSSCTFTKNHAACARVLWDEARPAAGTGPRPRSLQLMLARRPAASCRAFGAHHRGPTSCTRPCAGRWRGSASAPPTCATLAPHLRPPHLHGAQAPACESIHGARRLAARRLQARTVSEISGTTKKMSMQKGLGKARHGRCGGSVWRPFWGLAMRSL